MAKRSIKNSSRKSSSGKLSGITKSGKTVEVYSGSTKSAKKSSGTLYSKMLSQESEDMKRLSNWHSRAKPKKAKVADNGNKVPKISGFKKDSDGKIIAVKK